MSYGMPWRPDQAKLVEVVFDAWSEHKVWPNFQYVRGKLRQLGVDDAATVLRTFPILGQISPTTRHYCDVWFERTAGGPADDSKIAISVGGLAHLKAGKDFALTFVAVLDFCAQAYDNAPLHPDKTVDVSVTADQVARHVPSLPRGVLDRIGSLIDREHPVGVWSITPGGPDLPWSVGVRSDVVRYHGLTIERYLEMTREDVAPQQAVFPSSAHSEPAANSNAPLSFTTEASVTANKIEIEIHDEIYAHIGHYLATGDYFHAVEESYKLVREKLREITGKERATDAFAVANIEKIFGHQPRNDAEKDFFDGVKFLNMCIQFLRNEKAHTPATPLEPNLAVHYIALASLAYDLITRYVSDDTITDIEQFVLAKRRGYRSATAFYNDFENGKWLRRLDPPVNLESSSVRKVLKQKWLADADFTRSWDHSNVVLMQLELVADELTSTDIEQLLELPTHDSHGNDQSAGMVPFLEFIRQAHPGKISAKVATWIAAQKGE